MASEERENVSDVPDSSPSSNSSDVDSSPGVFYHVCAHVSFYIDIVALPTPIGWVQRQMYAGVGALDVLRGLLGQNWTPV